MTKNTALLLVTLLGTIVGCGKGGGGSGGVDVKLDDATQAEFAGTYDNALATLPGGKEGPVILYLFHGCSSLTCDKVRDENHSVSSESVDKAVAKECPAGASMYVSFEPKQRTFKSTINMSKGTKSASVYADGELKAVNADSVDATISASTQPAAAGSKSGALGTFHAKLCPDVP